MLSVAQLDERIERCLAILSDNPHSQVFAALAEAYRKRGDFGRAFAVCKGGLKSHPDYAPAHVVMAKLYLHQGMLDEARQSLMHAINIDGPTRTTDQLETEILLAVGDLDAAAGVVERLRNADSRHPLVKELEEQLRSARRAATKPAAADPSLSSEKIPVLPSFEPVSDFESPCTWQEWAEDLASRPRVQAAFVIAFHEAGTTPAAVVAEAGRSTPGANAVAACSGMFAAIDADLRAKAGGSLTELRIERPDGEVWIRRQGECVLGFLAMSKAGFGALRQLALDWAAHVESEQFTPANKER